MNLKQDAMTSLFQKLAIGIATSVALGGGAAVIHNTATNAVQDNRIQQLERVSEKLGQLTEKLDETNKNVAVLNERLYQEVIVHEQTRLK